MSATDLLIKKHFKVKDFKNVIEKVNKKEETYFTSNVFMLKDVFIQNLNKLDKEINELADAYKMAQEASKSGSIIQNFASAGLGSIQKEYIQKRKIMVHHVSLFVKKK